MYTDAQTTRLHARMRLRQYADLVGGAGNEQLAEDIRSIVEHSDQSENVASACGAEETFPMPAFVKVPAESVLVVADSLRQVLDAFPNGILVLPDNAEAIAIQGDRS